MRVLFIYPRQDYGDENHGLGLEELHMVMSLVDAGVVVTRFDFNGTMQRHGQQIMNELLRTEFSNGPYDAIIYVPLDGTEITEETWSYVENKTPRVLWLFNDVWRFSSFGCERCWDYDWVVTDDPAGEQKYKDLGFGDNVLFVPRGCRTKWFRDYNPSADRPIDISFVGQAYGYRPEKLKAILELLPPDTKTLIGNFNQKYFKWADYVSVMGGSKIVLSFGKASQGDHWQIKTRDFEATAAGALLLADSPDVELVLDDGLEFCLFDTPESAVEKIKYYLAHPEERIDIASRGQAYTMSHHDYRFRFDELFRRMGLIHG